jgi:hypothetical protein
VREPVNRSTQGLTAEESQYSALPANGLKPSAERHFSVAEIAEIWQLSRDAVTKLFQNEPGVLVLGDTNPRRRKRKYLTLRISQSVLERVHGRYSLYS